jgi:DNA repair photolyase
MSEHQQMNQADLDLEAKDPYAYFMRNEPALNLIEPQVDPENGLRYTERLIGMTRNAKEEQKKRLRVYLDPMPHVILDQNIPVRGWYKAKHEPPNVRPRPCYTESILTQPYGGFCSVGCAFCYINNGGRGYRSQGITVVDPKYPEKIAKQFDRMKIGAAVYMSSFIDPFLALEDVYHNTQRTAQAAVDRGLPIYFLTRRTVPDWAYDMLTLNPYSYMQFSINTPDPDTWRRLSPRAIPLPDMIDQVREMHRRGIYVSIQVNPIVPGIVSNDDICELIHMLAEAGADHLIFKFVEIVYPSASAMIAQMTKRFTKRQGDEFKALFCDNIGGVKTVQEAYRKNALDRFSVECKKAGVTMSLCYEYEYERDDDGNILSKTGVSMGAKYMTSDQCHGHRVPVHIKGKDGKFHPMSVCPPSGCLTCAEQHKEAPCGDTRLFTAPALAPADLNVFEGDYDIPE